MTIARSPQIASTSNNRRLRIVSATTTEKPRLVTRLRRSLSLCPRRVTPARLRSRTLTVSRRKLADAELRRVPSERQLGPSQRLGVWFEVPEAWERGAIGMELRKDNAWLRES